MSPDAYHTDNTANISKVNFRGPSGSVSDFFVCLFIRSTPVYKINPGHVRLENICSDVFWLRRNDSAEMMSEAEFDRNFS